MTQSFRPSRSLASRALLLPFLSVLAGCGSLLDETPFRMPSLTMPSSWGQDKPAPAVAAAPREVAIDHWWTAFGDPALSALIEDVLKRNNDLAAAAFKVRAARLTAGLAEADLRPTADVSGNAAASRTLKGNRQTSRSYDATASLSYEVDLWGKLRRTADAQQWEALATQQDLESTALSLTATTADLYWECIYLKGRLVLSRESIAYAEQTLALVQVQYDSGAASSLELFEAQENVESQEASYIDLRRQLVEANNALSVLFDGPPRQMELARETLPESSALPPVAAGLPAEILERRPDLRASEMRLRESLASVDAARAGFFPTLTLTGSGGGSSVSLKDILANPLASLGAGVTLPFVNWNQKDLTLRVSRAEYEEAVATFRQTLYEALGEVEDALSARQHYAEQGVRLTRAVTAAEGAERLYETRYRSGAETLQSWLDAQEKRRTLQESLLENRYNQLTAMVSLYKTLGGGMPDLTVPPEEN